MYSVDIENNGEYGFNVKSGGYEFTVDIKGKGITPPAVLLASLGTCVGVYIRRYAEGANINMKDFRIKVDAKFDKEPCARFNKVDVSIDLKGVQLEERRKAALLNFIKNCPVHNTLKANPSITFTMA